MVERLFRTDTDVSRTVLRILLGGVFFAHGAQKLLGWFGGRGFSAALHGFETSLHIPFIIAVLPILAESIGGLALVLGFFTRLAALSIAVDMTVAVAVYHYRVGFFMNWSGAQKGEGFEYHVLVFAITAALMIGGGGRWSLDRLISGRLKRGSEAGVDEAAQ